MIATVPAPSVRRSEPMRVALITEGTYPHHHGGVSVWCDQVVRGLSEHQYEVVAIVGSGNERPEWAPPPNVVGLTPIPLWAPAAAPRPSKAQRSAMMPMLQRFFDTILDGGTPRAFLSELHQLFLAAQDGQLRPCLSSPEAVELVLTHMRAHSAAVGSSDTGAGAPAPPTVADAVEALVLVEHYLRPLELHPRRADLIHAVSNGLASLPAITAKWTHGTPFLLTEHGLYLRERLLAHRPGTLHPHVRSLLLRFFKRLVEASYQVADCIAPVSHYCELWELKSGAQRSRIRPVHNGVDPDRFAYDPGEPDHPTLVFVGRIDPLKDIETLIRAFAQVRAVLPDARLRMFGPRVSESYAERCESLVTELGLDGAAVFEGPVDAPADAYRAGQVVLLTSISEGFPFAVLEAMACGRPVVATDVGGVAEAIAQVGVIVPPRDPAAVAEAALILLGDADLRRSLGRRARERVISRFTLSACVTNYRGLYGDLTSPSTANEDGADGMATAVAVEAMAVITEAAESTSDEAPALAVR
jgi:glycosyltransferase involved in cell wall biosynthesis